MKRLFKSTVSKSLELLQCYPPLKLGLVRILSLFPRVHKRLRFFGVKLGVLPEVRASEGGWIGPILKSDGRIDWRAYPQVVREIYEELRKNFM